ncbi:MAG: UDP-3-O-acyl-N-acetylglucosamine deacetylase [Blastopirellula sp. JB062]
MKKQLLRYDGDYRYQQTLASSVSVEGVGYWSGKSNRVEFRPAPIDTGITFVREDLPSRPHVPALACNRIEVPRRTNLTVGGASVEMVEHVLAALSGLQVDNCEVAVVAPEMPGLDGSSAAYVDAIRKAGIVEQQAVRKLLIVSDIVRVGDDEAWVEARPNDKLQLDFKYRLDYGFNSPIGRETLTGTFSPEHFERELSSARTFILENEAEWLRSQGLCQQVGFQDLIVFGPEGPIENELRFEDECVRHKTLDLVGDLALSGCDIVGSIIAYRSGHRLNAELVKQLLLENQVQLSRRRSA